MPPVKRRKRDLGKFAVIGVPWQQVPGLSHGFPDNTAWLDYVVVRTIPTAKSTKN